MFSDQLPLPPKLDNVTADETAAKGELFIRVEKRRTRLTDGAAAPAKENCWRYIRSDSSEAGGGLLETFLGPVINVRRGHLLEVHWRNTIGASMEMTPQMMTTMNESMMLEDPPIHVLPMDMAVAQWKSMNRSVGVVTHLHGGKVRPPSDGWPLKPVSFVGNPYHFPTRRTYYYPNDQRAAMLWFHDHAMDNTAVQVQAGLAGLYFVRDKSDKAIFDLIGGAGQEIPLVVQDRVVAGDTFDYTAGITFTKNADGKIDEFQRSEFLGTTIFVNGRPWPTHAVERKVYRLRILNGSNARSYAFALVDWSAVGSGGAKRVWYSDLMTVIGNEAGLISKSATLSASAKDYYALLAPGERLDILLDLTQVDPSTVSALRLVNLAVNSAVNAQPADEAIFQTDQTTLVAADGTAIGCSVIQPAPANANDAAPLTASGVAAVAPLMVMEFNVSATTPAAAPLDSGKIDAILAANANEDDFKLSGGKLVPALAKTAYAQNRFILLMNDTRGLRKDTGTVFNDLTNGPWRDTQMWELAPAAVGDKTFSVPFDASLANPATQGDPAGETKYKVQRATFFKQTSPTDALWRTITDKPDLRYADLHEPSLRPVEGTYERWYVANIGNEQPGSTKGGGGPDMHPFHIHLVNFVVTRRWQFDPSSRSFTDTTNSRRLDFDGSARHDLVRVQQNELVELLVYFPCGYCGRYPYHCHVVEHEDMGMMLHFEVQPRGDSADDLV